MQQLQHALAHLQHVTNQEGAGEADGGGASACTAAAPPATSALLPYAIACRDEVRAALLRLRAAGAEEGTSAGQPGGDADGMPVGGGGTQQTPGVNSHLSAVLSALDTLAAAAASAELAGEDAAVPRLTHAPLTTYY